MKIDIAQYIPSEYTPKFRMKLHLVFWPVLFFINLINIYLNIYGQSYLSKKSTNEGIMLYSIINTLLVLGFTLVFYFVFSKYLFQKKNNSSFFKIIFLGLIFYLIIYGYTIFTLEVLYHLFPQLNNYNYIIDFVNFSTIKLRNSFWFIIYLYVPFFAFPFFFKYLVHIYYLKDKTKTLQIINKNNELQFLKDQIQPHFVFNMLNGIYSLVVDSDPKSSNAILKLSEMLRFSLYQSNQKFINLESEIEYIKNRIEIEKIYHGFSEKNFKIKANYDVSNALIKPMILAKLFDSFMQNLNPKSGYIELIINRLTDILEIKITFRNDKISANDHRDFHNFERYLALQYPKCELTNIVFLPSLLSFELKLNNGE